MKQKKKDVKATYLSSLQKRNTSSGITLIALIITIIILLILAMVSIKLLMNAGIIGKAKDGTNEYKIAEEKEKIGIGYHEYQIEKVAEGAAELEVKGAEVTGNEESNWNITFQETGNQYILKADGTIELIGQEKPAELTDIYVTLYEDGTLGFSSNEDKIEGKIVSKEYENIKEKTFNYNDNKAPWNADADNIKTVEIQNEIVPNETAYWFYGCKNLIKINNIENLNTQRVTDMSYMFYNCNEIETINLSKFNTSNVTSMKFMFYACKKLTNLNLSDFNTKKVKDMASMFSNAISLENIEGLDKLDTSNVKSMSNLFLNCLKITDLNVSNFNTEKVEDMSLMFCGDNLNIMSLKNIEGLDKLNTSNVTSMRAMFDNCPYLTNLDLSNFNTSKVEDMSYMFFCCSSLTELDLSSFNTSKVKDMSNMFFMCYDLKLIYGMKGKWITDSGTNSSDMFYDCGTNRITYKTYLEGNKLVGYEIMQDTRWTSDTEGNVFRSNGGYYSGTTSIVTLDPEKKYKIKKMSEGSPFTYSIIEVDLDYKSLWKEDFISASEEKEITGKKYIVITVMYRKTFKIYYR